jgi:predicted metal-dependent hydrolase
MSPEIRERFLEGLKKFNEKKFYDAHDIWEDVWFAVRGKDRSFYQGLIHLAVGFHHIANKKNSLGANLQLRKSVAKLSEYAPEHEGIELTALLKKVQKCIMALKDGDIKKFKPTSIPKIKILN